MDCCLPEHGCRAHGQQPGDAHSDSCRHCPTHGFGPRRAAIGRQLRRRRPPKGCPNELDGALGREPGECSRSESNCLPAVFLHGHDEFLPAPQRSTRDSLQRHFVPDLAGYSSLMVHKSIPDSYRDLLDAEFATLATVGEDGYPHLSEVWFLAQDDQIALSLNTSRQKLKNLATEPACTVLILDLANPYRYVEIRGTAVVEPDVDMAFARQVGAKYGADLREHDVPGDRRVIVRLVPTRIRAVDMSAA